MNKFHQTFDNFYETYQRLKGVSYDLETHLRVIINIGVLGSNWTLQKALTKRPLKVGGQTISDPDNEKSRVFLTVTERDDYTPNGTRWQCTAKTFYFILYCLLYIIIYL